MTWGKRIFWALMVGALIMGGCQTMGYDCKTWSHSDGAEYNRAKRDACFPDCDSCGPVLRGRNPYE